MVCLKKAVCNDCGYKYKAVGNREHDHDYSFMQKDCRCSIPVIYGYFAIHAD